MSEAVETTCAHNEQYRTFSPKKFELEALQSHDLYHWPEFKALAERLGIDWEARTMDLTIFIPLDGTVRIVHEYQGVDLEQKQARSPTTGLLKDL